MELFTRACRITLTRTLILGIIAVAIFVGQSSSTGPKAEILAEVVAIHTSPEAERTYLYLRVLSNGMAEWQTSKAAEKELATRSKALTKDDFLRIKSILDDPRLKKLGPKYETRFAVVDSWTTWKVQIARKGHSRNIEILEFSPDLAKTLKSPYPDVLVKLGCTFKRLRADVSEEPPSLDKTCEEVFDRATD
jgi:hypothetical protein